MTTKQLADKIGLNYEHDTKIVTLEETAKPKPEHSYHRWTKISYFSHWLNFTDCSCRKLRNKEVNV